jgi:putative colanic acid biosynthesis acetyltransferase WcaF
MTILNANDSNPLKGGPSFSLANRLTRLAFGLTWLLLARWTPRQFNPWRMLLLRLFGARLGRGVTVYGSARIWLPAHLEMDDGATLGPGVECYCMAPIAIGAGAIVSQRAHLCAGTHDHRDPHFQLIARPIRIGAQAWIATEAFVGPGVTIGEGAVLGARGCAFGELKPWTVYSGNPAVSVGARAIRAADPASAATE